MSNDLGQEAYATLQVNMGETFSFVNVELHHADGQPRLVAKRFNGRSTSVPISLRSYTNGMTYEDGLKAMACAVEDALTALLAQEHQGATQKPLLQEG